mmetsp:Transcript_49839/g.103981  ORF Transcript_49839/g.103981 Transcript_49839/m.103981 type:complete len:204 (-) Transcript_49839:4331-4942(-)
MVRSSASLAPSGQLSSLLSGWRSRSTSSSSSTPSLKSLNTALKGSSCRRLARTSTCVAFQFGGLTNLSHRPPSIVFLVPKSRLPLESLSRFQSGSSRYGSRPSFLICVDHICAAPSSQLPWTPTSLASTQPSYSLNCSSFMPPSPPVRLTRLSSMSWRISTNLSTKLLIDVGFVTTTALDSRALSSFARSSSLASLARSKMKV